MSLTGSLSSQPQFPIVSRLSSGINPTRYADSPSNRVQGATIESKCMARSLQTWWAVGRAHTAVLTEYEQDRDAADDVELMDALAADRFGHSHTHVSVPRDQSKKFLANERRRR